MKTQITVKKATYQHIKTILYKDTKTLGIFNTSFQFMIQIPIVFIRDNRVKER